MSRRPVDRSAQNLATLKQLVKLESNKTCADCKRNKHPRWASWNIGVFVCIRCSGIHRSMGVHISRVKSVDLDSWTDEQLASMLRWGNGRANKYWEDKLAPGHVPNEAKIENFIRTKYDGKRWVMDGPMPDPSTLSDAADDDVPLNVVREKATMERAGSLRNGSSSIGNLPQPPRRQQVDLFGDMEEAAPARPSTTEPAVRAAPSKAPAAPPKQTRAGESLLGMDFFGSTQSAPPRPSSATSGMTAPASTGRADLKNSILSLYASAPKSAAPAPQIQHRQQPSQSNVDFFGGMQSAPTQSQPAAKSDPFASMSSARPAQSKPQSSNLDLFGGMQSPPLASPVQQQANYSNFGGMQSPPLTTSAPKPQPQPQAAAPKPQINSNFFGGMQSPPLPTASSFSSLASSTGPATTQKGSLSGGSFFDPKPAPPPKDFSPPRKQGMSPIRAAPAPTQTKNSTFGMDSLSISGANSNPWGNDNAWAQPDPAPAPAPAPPKPQPSQAPQPVHDDDDFGGWSHASPVRTHATPAAAPQQQEEFGGWSHASPVSERPPPAPAAAPAPKQNFGGGQDDLFGNVWG
jgi:stromal membrane-associated protein